MSRTITLGQFPEDHDWVDRLVLPHVPEVPAPGLLTDALDFALKHRTGVVALGTKGAGKTYARRRVVDAFAAREARRAAADGLYQPQRLVVASTVRAQRPEHVYVTLWQAMLNETPELSVRGRRKTQDDLRAEFVYLAFEERVAALVLDEGEMSRPAVLEVARDIMSEAEELGRARAVHPSASAADGASAAVDARGTGGSGAYGVAVLVVGTPGLGTVLSTSPEKGQRWAKVVEIPPPDAAAVAAIYARWFPGFAPAICAMGDGAWRAHVQTTVVRQRPVPMRLLDRHAREYTRVMAAQNRHVRGIADVPFDRETFAFTFRGLDDGNSRGERG